MKKTYKTPEILDFFQLTNQALGQTGCQNGHNPVGNCMSGHNASSGNCHGGHNASGGYCQQGQNASGGACSSFGQGASGGACLSFGQNASGGACSPGGNPGAKRLGDTDQSCNNGDFPGVGSLCMNGHSDTREEKYGKTSRFGKEERKVGDDGCEMGSSASACFSGNSPGLQYQCAGGAAPLESGCNTGYEAVRDSSGCKAGTIPGPSDCNQGYDACSNGGKDDEQGSCFSGAFAGPEMCELGASALMEGCLSGMGEEGCAAGNNPYDVPCVAGGEACATGYSPF